MTSVGPGRGAGTVRLRAGDGAVVGGVAVSLLLVVAVLLASRGPGPLDQPDAARQRDGLVLDGPTVEPAVAGVHLRDMPNVLLFVREPPDADELDSWRQSLPAAAQVTVVVQSPAAAEDDLGRDDGRASSESGGPRLVGVVEDPDESLAAAVRLPEPVDGGPGIGVFLGHISSHYVPGGDRTWLALAVLAVLAYTWQLRSWSTHEQVAPADTEARR